MSPPHPPPSVRPASRRRRRGPYLPRALAPLVLPLAIVTLVGLATFLLEARAPAAAPPRDRELQARRAQAGDRHAGDVSAGEVSTGDGSAGDGSAGDGSAGDRSAGDRSAGDRSAGDRSAGALNAGEGGARDPGGPPGLLFEPPALDLGRLAGGEVRTLAFPWRRAGAAPLEVLALVPACGCLVAGPLPDILAPGAHGVLHATLHVPRRPGPFRYGLKVVTDARRHGGAAIARVVVEGWIGRPLSADPATVDLGPSSPGRQVARTVTLRIARPFDARPPAARLVGLEGAVSVRVPPVPGRYELDVRLVLPATPGPAAGALEVVAASGAPAGEPAPRLRIPVEALVVSR